MIGKNRAQLEGKVAIVTGAGRGCGRAIALALASKGAHVIVSDINLEWAKVVADEVGRLGSEGEAVRVDVSSSEEVRRMVKQTLDRFGRINILVNNAGISGFCSTEELSEVEWDHILNTNLKGQFLCSQAVGKWMIKQKEGKIINIASISANNGSPGLAAYSASKAGVLALMKVLAVEWAKFNITVNAVSPGMVDTLLVREAIQKVGRGNFEGRTKRIPMRRLIKPASIANAVVFLASPEADDITGQEIVVDCGISVLYPAWIFPDEQSSEEEMLLKKREKSNADKR